MKKVNDEESEVMSEGGQRQRETERVCAYALTFLAYSLYTIFVTLDHKLAIAVTWGWGGCQP